MDANIACIMALGTHRSMADAEMRVKVGDALFERIRVFNHEWRDPQALVDLGTSSRGTRLLVNRAVVEADLVIGMRTIFNAVMNDSGGVVGLFFGEMRMAFQAGVKLAREIYGVEYHEVPDIVLANSHPCDLDFWQSHKSLYPAQRMVKPGGTIIVCTPAPEGVSSVHTELLDFTSWPSTEIKAAYRNGRLKNGVACALAIAWSMVREQASVINYSPGISPEEKAALGHTHAPSLAWAVEEALRRQGPDARVTALAHAPEMLPIGPVEG